MFVKLLKLTFNLFAFLITVQERNNPASFISHKFSHCIIIS